MKKGGAGGRKGSGGSRRSGKGRSTGAAPYVVLAVVVTVGALILLSQQLLPMVAIAGTGPTPAALASTPAPKRTPTVVAAVPAAAKAAVPTVAPRAAGGTQPTPMPRAALAATPPAAATGDAAGRTPTSTPRAGAALSPTATAATPAARATVPALPVPAAPGEIISVSTSRKLVALTFDAGSDLGATLETLEVLRARGIRSTFFITGIFAEKWPAVVKQMASDGHELGNHSYSHPDFTKLSDKEIRQELDEAEDAIARAAGRVTVALVRTPFGSRDARVLRVIGETGYRSVYWALDSADWRPEATSEGVVDRVLKGVGAGDVVVQHCSTVASARGLPAILEGLNQRGLVPVTVGSLLSENR